MGTLGGKADQKGEQNVVSMNSLSTMPCARLMTGHDSMPRLNLKSPAAPYNAGACERCCAQPIWTLEAGAGTRTGVEVDPERTLEEEHDRPGAMASVRQPHLDLR